MNDKIKRQPWMASEIHLLTQIYPYTKNEDISVRMNKSITSISSHAHSMGLKKSRQFKSKLIGIRNKINGRDLTIDTITNIASKYKTRGEFQLKDPSAYQTARRAGYLEEICKHMSVVSFSIPQLILRNIMDTVLKSNSLYNTRKIIPPYEIDIFYPEFKLAFEYHGRRWHSDNIRDIIKKQLFEENNIKIIYIIENNRNYESDIKTQLAEKIDEINLLCNSKISENDILTHNVEKIYSTVYNMSDLLAIAKTYTSFSQFRQCNTSAYNKLLKLRLIDVATSHMNDRRRQHTVEDIKTTISKYSTLKDFIQNDFGSYLYVQRNKLWHLISHLESNHR